VSAIWKLRSRGRLVRGDSPTDLIRVGAVVGPAGITLFTDKCSEFTDEADRTVIT
jgi:hypothetical protein